MVEATLTSQRTMLTALLLRVAVVLAGLTLGPAIGTLTSRRRVLYVCNLLLMLYFPDHWLPVWLATAHSLAHQHIPFIDAVGLNVAHSACVDVMVHTVMHAYVMYYTAHELSFSVMALMTLVLIGCFYNGVVSLFSPVDDEEFIASSVFQALSSGAWLSLLAFNVQGVDYEPVLLTCMLLGAVNWSVFKQSERTLVALFKASYFDLFFILPVWVLVYNQITS